MAERLASDIAADLREWTSGDPEFGPLLIEAADKLDGLIACLAAAERERDQAKARGQRVREKVAQEIEARRDRLAEDDVWENEGRAYLEIAAAIARGTGSES